MSRPSGVIFHVCRVTSAAVLIATAACGGADSTNGGSLAPVATIPVVTSLSLDKTSLTFADIGQADTLRATATDQNGKAMPSVPFSWTSSDPLVATVSGFGVVTTTGLGSAQITVSAGDKTAIANIAVPVALKTITLDRATLSFAHIGERDTLRATALDQAARPMAGVTFAWASSDVSIASVDTSGVVTALGLGNTQISVTASSKTAATQVTVAAVALESTMCTGGSPIVVLLVEAQLRFPIAASLTRFANDLCADGYTVWLAESVPKTPLDIRGYLADAWTRSAHRLTGVLLIGNIPRAYQYVILHSTNPSIPDTKEEVISYQYYADVNGTFSASPGYTAMHAYSFDVHGGSMDWELWVGVLPTYKGSTTATIDALVRYFDKNHAYRTGGPKPPRAFLEVSEFFVATTPADHTFFMTEMRDGAYSWTPFSNASTAMLYFNSSSAGLTAAQGYAALQAGVADFFEQDSHGFYGAGGQLTIAGVEANPIKTIFYWSNGCAIGDLDRPDNFLTSVVYSPTSSVLVGKGSTNNSGGMGNNQNGFFGHNIAASMTGGSSFGAALLSHVNVPLAFPWSDSREFHFGPPIIIGDPTLRLRP